MTAATPSPWSAAQRCRCSPSPRHYGFAADPTTTGALWAGAAVLAIALGALLAGAIVPTHMFSEPVREIVEYAEYVATTLVIVFAAWTIDLLHFVEVSLMRAEPLPAAFGAAALLAANVLGPASSDGDRPAGD